MHANQWDHPLQPSITKEKPQPKIETYIHSRKDTQSQTYAREFTMKPKQPGGRRPRGLSVGSEDTTTTTNTKITLIDGVRQRDVVTVLPAVVTYSNRKHKHEHVSQWHKPTFDKGGQPNTATYSNESPDQVRQRSGSFSAPP